MSMISELCTLVYDKYGDDDRISPFPINIEEEVEEDGDVIRLYDFIHDFLQNHEDVTQFEVHEEHCWDSPSVDVGVVWFAWVDTKNQLHTESFTWVMC